MRQLKYELYKVLSRGIFWCLLLACIAVCAFLYLNGQQYYISREDIEKSGGIINSYAGVPEDEIIADAEEKLKELSLRQTRLYYEQEPDNFVWSMQMEIEQLENPELYEKVMSAPETMTHEELSSESFAYHHLQQQLEYKQSYQDFLAAVKENADRMTSSTIFGKPGTFYYNNVVKTAETFERMENTEIGYGVGNGVTSVTQFIAGDVLLLFMVFTLVVMVFYDEYRKGLFTIIRSCKNGRGEVICAKLTTVAVLTAVIAVMYSALMIFLGGYRYGYGDLSRTIQSVQEFRNCVFHISVGQYLALAFIIKGLLFMGAALFFSFVFTVFKNNVVTVVIVALGPIAVLWILYAVIPSSFVLNHFKYINPFYWLDSVKLFGNYLNLNFFTLPVNIFTILCPALAVLIAGSAAGASVRFITDRTIAKKPLIERIINRTSQSVRRRSKTASIILSEGFKFFVQEKVLIMLLAVLAFSLYIVSGYTEITFREEEQVYRKYMYRLSGKVTEEKLEYYDGIANEYLQAGNQSAQPGGTGYRYAGFLLVEQDLEYLRQLESMGIEGYFTDQLTAKAYFDSDNVGLKNGVIFMAAVILCISSLYGSEVKKNMTPLLKSTPRGRGQLVAAKYLWAFSSVIIIYGLVYIPYYIYVYESVGVIPLSAPLQNYGFYETVQYNMTFGELIALHIMCVIINGLTAAALVAGVSVKLKNRVLAMIISTALICVPLLLQIRGIDMRWFSMNNGFLLFDTITYSGAVGKVLIQQGVILLIGAGSVLLTCGEFGALPKHMGGMKGEA